MAVIAFDTLAYAKKLRQAGVPEAQAEVQAEAMAELVEERLTTKRDLHELEERLSARMQLMEERLNTQMRELEERLNTQMRSMEERLNAQTRELEYKMTVRLGSMLVVAVGVMATLVKIL